MASLAHQMHQIQEFVGYPIEKLLDCDNKPENTDTAFFTYGRFQPGHRGHETMIMTMLAKADRSKYKTQDTEITPEKTNVYVFVSPSGGPNEKNPQKNPLTPRRKSTFTTTTIRRVSHPFCQYGSTRTKKIEAHLEHYTY